MNIVVALLIFTVIVVAHELGHFFLAKKNGVGVPEFSVGMGPRLITVAKTKNGFVVKFLCSGKYFAEREDWQDVTKYSWKLLPLGGSCAMVGEDEDNDAEDSFNSKGVWARFAIIFAGPFFNFILAFILAVILLANAGIDYPSVDFVYNNQPAEEAGIKVGDTIRSINGHKISIGRQIDTYILLHPLTGEDVTIGYERDGKAYETSYSPKYKTWLFGFSYNPSEGSDTVISTVAEGKAFEKAGIEVGDRIISVDSVVVNDGEELKRIMAEKNVDGSPIIFGIEKDGKVDTYEITPDPYETNTLGFASYYSVRDQEHSRGGSALDILRYSLVEVKYWIETTVASLGQLITGKISTKELSGPVGIVDTVGSVIEQSKESADNASDGLRYAVINLLIMSILISANLGVMNLLPIPALDGGRLLFILIEAIRRKPIDRDKEGYVHFAGFVVLMLFMVFVMYNDIIKIIQR